MGVVPGRARIPNAYDDVVPSGTGFGRDLHGQVGPACRAGFVDQSGARVGVATATDVDGLGAVVVIAKDVKREHVRFLVGNRGRQPDVTIAPGACALDESPWHETEMRIPFDCSRNFELRRMKVDASAVSLDVGAAGVRPQIQCTHTGCGVPKKDIPFQARGSGDVENGVRSSDGPHAEGRREVVIASAERAGGYVCGRDGT